MLQKAKMILPLSLIAMALAMTPSTDVQAERAAYERPLEIPFPEGRPYSPQMATLGKMLFFDPRLSGAKNMNCASCHNPSFGYEVPVPTPIGAANTKLRRQAPTLQNIAWVEPLFWDGRSPTLEEQARHPIQEPVEMNGYFPEIIRALSEVSLYNTWFKRLFPERGMTRETILTAIATFQRTIVTGTTPFDRWVRGEEDAISEAAKRGFQLFNGDANCATCHSGWNFTDNRFHDTGLPTNDIGRAKQEPTNVHARFAVKTPSLRNLEYRAPYMRDGSLRTIDDVLQFYMEGGIQRPSLSPAMTRLQISMADKADLLAFLKTLTADKTEISLPILPN